MRTLASPADVSARDLYESTSAVVGQEEARRKLATVLRRQAIIADGIELPGAGVLVAGNTGVGKSFMTRAMCRSCGMPFAEANATQYTEAGYVGLNLTQVYLPLLFAAAAKLDHELRLGALRTGEKLETPDRKSPLDRPHEEREAIAQMAATGVVLLDEFDKWFGHSDPMGRDKGKSLQDELLRLIEGEEVWVSDSDDDLGVKLDTSRILIIACGAFVGLERRVAKRLSGEGHKLDVATAWRHVEPADFIDYGMKEELAGRLSTYVMLRPMTEHSLRAILDAPGGIVDEYRQRFKQEGVELVIPDDAKLWISREALKLKVGARSLRFIMGRILDDALFDARSGMLTLTADMVQRRCAEIG